jgi:hypothetical protein
LKTDADAGLIRSVKKGAAMRTNLITLSLLMVAGTPALAMAQGSAQAEAVLRADAVQLGPILTRMTQRLSEFQMKQKLITDENDHFYCLCGTKPDTSPGTRFGDMGSEKSRASAEL